MVLLTDPAAGFHILGTFGLQKLSFGFSFTSNCRNIVLRLLVNRPARRLCGFGGGVWWRRGLLRVLFLDRRSRRWDFRSGEGAAPSVEVGLLALVDVRAGRPALHLTDLDVPPTSGVLLYHLGNQNTKRLKNTDES